MDLSFYKEILRSALTILEYQEAYQKQKEDEELAKFREDRKRFGEHLARISLQGSAATTTVHEDGTTVCPEWVRLQAPDGHWFEMRSLLVRVRDMRAPGGGCSCRGDQGLVCNDDDYGIKPYDNSDDPLLIPYTDALIRCNAFSKACGLEPAYRLWHTCDGEVRSEIRKGANGYRLPTSDEWLAANTFPACDSASSAHFRLKEQAVYKPMLGMNGLHGGTYDGRNSVAQKLCNANGIYDMIGLAEEFCHTKGGVSRIGRGMDNVDLVDRFFVPIPIFDMDTAIGAIRLVRTVPSPS
jgi:hypothetical protein